MAETPPITFEQLERFAADLEFRGAASLPGGYHVKMVYFGPEDWPAYERVIHGDRQTILGWNGERFESLDHARRCAVYCARKYYAVDMAYENAQVA